MKRNHVLALLPLVALTLGSSALAWKDDEKPIVVPLNEDPAAANAGLQGATGIAFVQEDLGHVRIVVDLHGASLPPGAVLEGWVVDAGLLGGPGTTSVSDDDELYGTPFGNASFDEMVDNSPYALSTGMLDKQGKDRYAVGFHVSNNLSPYDAVVVTLESDGNGENYDPRPGSIVVAGPIVR